MGRTGIPIIAVAIAAFAVGFVVARALDAPIVQTGRADAQEDGGGSISTDDWTYGFGPGVRWTDETGTWHEGGRPECLEPATSLNVRFAATEVTVEGVTWRPVVWVDCGSATPYP